MTKTKLEQEINVDTGSLISDHKYEPREPLEPWGLCRYCNMAEAAHKESVRPYKPEARRAKKETIPKGKVKRAKRRAPKNGKAS